MSHVNLWGHVNDGIRLWLPKLFAKLTKLHRLKLRENAEKLKVTIRKKKADGSYSVSFPQLLNEF